MKTVHPRLVPLACLLVLALTACGPQKPSQQTIDVRVPVDRYATADTPVIVITSITDKRAFVAYDESPGVQQMAGGADRYGRKRANARSIHDRGRQSPVGFCAAR